MTVYTHLGEEIDGNVGRPFSDAALVRTTTEGVAVGSGAISNVRLKHGS